jgi:NADPH-dependent curcumin reductase CurA
VRSLFDFKGATEAPRHDGETWLTGLTARQIVLAPRPQGRPKLTDFRFEEFAIPPLSEGQVLLQVRYLSLDPYMRGRTDDAKSYAKPVQVGEAMTGETIAEVVASRHEDYAAGDLVLAMTGWRTRAVMDAASLRKVGRQSPRGSACWACRALRPTPD